MNKIISFSLWGNNPKYTIGAIKNAELALSIYPEWKCLFFIGSDTDKEIISKLKEFPNTSIIHKLGACDWTGMFWRFETSYNPEIDVSIFRDTDSRLNSREKHAVEDWLNSDKAFHIMRDHPHHGFPILGGMWGYKRKSNYDLKKLFDAFIPNNSYGTDYDFLGNILYPMIGDDKIVHDPFFENKPFPTSREGTEFVGDVYDEHNIRHPEFYKFLI
jgi:protein O-GlcNAc transferase